MGNDIVTSFPCFLVTTQLAAAIAKSSLTGAELTTARVTKDPQFVQFFPEVAARLPQWKWLVAGTATTNDFWVDEEGVLYVSQGALDLLSNFRLRAEFVHLVVDSYDA